jgi:glycine cleavage system transcriptional repressor
MSTFVITAIGQDRPGIVAEITGVLYRQGGNLEDTTMTRLRDQFAMMLVVQVAEEDVTAMETGLQVVAARLGLSLLVRPLSADTPGPEAPAEAYTVRVHGADRPGIVHAVTSALAQRSFNIIDLYTRSIVGAGGLVYVMVLDVQAPTGAAVEELETELARLGGALGVELSLELVDSEAL